MGVPVCRQCGRLLLRQAETPLFCLPETPDLVDNREFRGGVPEWLKGADCKSVGLAPTLVRIQPPPPNDGRPSELGRAGGWRTSNGRGGRRNRRGGWSSMVEQKASQLTTRGRFPSPPPPALCLSPLRHWDS